MNLNKPKTQIRRKKNTSLKEVRGDDQAKRKKMQTCGKNKLSV